jgi:hypothetical protein
VLRKVLLVLLVLLAALYVGADLGARALANAGVSKELQSSLQLSRRPDVSLGGFPFIPKLASGRFATVTATAHGISSGSVRFARVDLTLHDVEFSSWRVLRGADTTIGIGSGRGTATLTASDVSDALRSAGIHAEVTFAGGKVLIRPAGAAGPVEVTVSVHRRTLVLGSGALPAPLRIALPEVVPGIRYTRATISGSRAELGFDIRRTTLTIGG